MVSLYKTSLLEAWHAFLVNKKLWFLGVFLMLIGVEGEYALVIKNIEKIRNLAAMASISDLPMFIQKSFWDEQIVSEAFKLFVGDGAFFTALGFLVVLLLASFLIFTSQAVVIKASFEKSSYSLKAIWLEQRKNFRSVFFITALIKTGTFILGSFMLSLVAGIMSTFSFFHNDMFILLLFLIFTPLGIFSSFVATYAISYRVIYSAGTLESIRRGVILCANNLLISLESAFGVLIIAFLVSGLSFILAMAFIYSIIIGFIVVGTPEPPIRSLMGSVFIIFTFIIGAPLAVYIQMFWATLFKKLCEKNNLNSKTIRFLKLVYTELKKPANIFGKTFFKEHILHR